MHKYIKVAIVLFFFLVTTAVAYAKQDGQQICVEYALVNPGKIEPLTGSDKVLAHGSEEENGEYDDEGNLEEEENEVLPVDVLAVDGEEVPAHELYKIWTNSQVNPYRMRLSDISDAVAIDLSGYHYPLCREKIFPRQVTSEFGFRKRYRHHNGVDMKLNTGDPVFASFDGMVRIAMRHRSYGNYVVIRHYNGLETVYAHLSRIDVKINQIVKAGEEIGKGGSTGRSTSPHLHYELRYLGIPIPPRTIVDFENYSTKSDVVLLGGDTFEYVREMEKIRFWVVKKGDTLGRIAQKTGVPIKRLCQLNNIKSTTILRVGQRIRCT